MTPTLAEQLLGLAKLNKEQKIEVPVRTVRLEMMMLRQIQEALNKGHTWADVGQVLLGRRDGKAAKRFAKTLARSTQRELLRNADLSSEPAADS